MCPTISKIIFCLSFVSICLIGYSQTIIVKPYLQNPFQTEMTIMWEAASDGIGTVEWGLSPFELNNSITSSRNNVVGTSQIHTAVLPSLIKKTKYYYRVIMEGGQSTTIRSFVTLSDANEEESIQLMAISDMQRDGSHPDKFREIIEEGIIPIINSEIGSSITDLEGVLIPGDLVATGGAYSQWKDYFFNPSDSLNGYVPFLPVPGNHEYFGGGLPNFKHYINLPSNGVTGLEDECWYKDISNVRIIGLNSNSGSTDQNSQLNWLSGVLDSACADANIDFVFAQLHHPFKSELWTPGENGFTGKVIDSLEAFSSACGKASIHFFGHTHGYSRGQSRDHIHLWINVATAGGAIDNWGEFPNADYDEFVKSQDEYGFVYIDVRADEDPEFTIRRYGRGDQDVIVNNELRDELTVINDDIKPQRPYNIFPKGDTLLPHCIELQSSQFYGLEDSIQASHWQVSKDELFSSMIVDEQWWQNENFYEEVDLQAGDDLTNTEVTALEGNSLYFWRVRYRNQNLEWSDWSNSTTMYVMGQQDTLSGELIGNGGAESGLENWLGDIEALENGACNSVLPYQGSYNFAVGGVCSNESDEGLAWQVIDLSAYESEIDTDSTAIAFGGYMRDFSGSDIPEMYIELYENSVLVASSEVLSNPTGVWVLKSGEEDVPVGVDGLRLFLKGTRNAGTDNDCYFDNISVFLVKRSFCFDCIGNTEIDGDNDGYCEDVDCDDNDASIYPGSLEICDGLDNNCDGFFDTSDTILWTGNGGTNFWKDPENWDQNIVPLSCQHVVIPNLANVTIDDAFACKSLFVESTSMLNISSDGMLLVNSLNGSEHPSVVVRGIMIINGEIEVKNSGNAAFEIFGTLTNNSKIGSSQILLDSIIIRSGGQFNELGRTILK